jgi:hypothetical protein
MQPWLEYLTLNNVLPLIWIYVIGGYLLGSIAAVFAYYQVLVIVTSKIYPKNTSQAKTLINIITRKNPKHVYILGAFSWFAVPIIYKDYKTYNNELLLKVAKVKPKTKKGQRKGFGKNYFK